MKKIVDGMGEIEFGRFYNKVQFPYRKRQIL